MTRFRTLRPQLAATALALGISLGGTAAVAQDASPDAAVNCQVAAEEVVVGTPEASPVTEMEGTTVEDEATIADVTGAVEGCNPDVAGSIEIDEVIEYEDGSFGVTYQYMENQQVLRVHEVYSAEGDAWTLVSREAEAPQTDLDVITLSVKVGDDSLEVTPGQSNLTDATRLRVESSASSDVTVGLYASSEDVDTESLAGTDISGLEGLAGEQVIPAGETQEVLFEGLEEGTYIVVVSDDSGSIVSATSTTIDPPMELPV